LDSADIEGMTGRIEWSRYSGEDVEYAIAVMLCLRDPHATLIKPARGDGGIDILVRRPDDTVDVYQVKKFALKFESPEKRQVTDSIERLCDYAAKNSLVVNEWHLVMPMTMTLPRERWLRKKTSEAGFGSTHWSGLSFIEGLGTQYPEVLDYYFRDGRDRLSSAVGQLTTALGLGLPKGDGTAIVEPNQLKDYLLTLSPLLNTDPHFLYSIRWQPDLIEHHVGGVAVSGSVIASVTSRNAHGAVTVDIYARFADALKLRPIPLSTVFSLEDDEVRNAMEEFVRYGKPFSAPAAVTTDLPGGLGSGTFSALVTTSVEPTDKRFRIGLFDAEQKHLASVTVQSVGVSVGWGEGAGMYLQGREEGGTFGVDMRMDANAIGDVDLKITGPAGKPVVSVRSGLEFLARLQGAKSLAFAPVYGPIRPGNEPVSTPELTEEMAEDIAWLSRLANALTILQDHVDQEIIFPDGSIKHNFVKHVEFVAALVGEEPFEGAPMAIDLAIHKDFGNPTLQWHSRLRLDVDLDGTQKFDLGYAHVACEKMVPVSLVSETPEHEIWRYEGADGTPFVYTPLGAFVQCQLCDEANDLRGSSPS
jgi:hypothetical protein